ncbi:HXT3, partial [Symbiodinium pilosum]
GITSSAGPAFISEVAPEKIRGMLVGIYQNNVCLAILAAAALNYTVHELSWGWRLSLGLQVAMGLLVVLGLFFVCETPRFLESAGRSTEALQVLTRLRGGDHAAAQHELKEVQSELENERQAGDATWSEVFTVPFYRNVVIIGCAIQFFQIMTGINAIVSFSGTLFKALGLHGIAFSIIPFVSFTAGNAVGSFGLVDRAGRRPLLLLGMMLMCVTMLVGGAVAILAQDPETGHIGEAAGFTIVAMIVTYMFSFGISWGFGAWLYISEIMPLRVRGKAVGLCTAMNWGPANVLSAFLTPQMISSPLGPGGTLIFFGCVCLVVIPFVATCVPETKGKTLEESITQGLAIKAWGLWLRDDSLGFRVSV